MNPGTDSVKQASSESPIKILTVSDLHQSKILVGQLRQAIARHTPQVVVLLGDFLESSLPQGNADLYSVAELAQKISQISGPQFCCVRGNHEESNWLSFVEAWPLEQRELSALNGTPFSYGPLTLLGFPCDIGWEEPWNQSLPQNGHRLSRQQTGHEGLPADVDAWLPCRLRTLGEKGRILWLMHEPPLAHTLGGPRTFHPQWLKAIRRWQPAVVICGHEHQAPLKNRCWLVKEGKTLCINVGQHKQVLHYCLLEFVFPEKSPLLQRINIKAYPWDQNYSVPPELNTGKTS